MTSRRIPALVLYCLVVLFAVGILWLLFSFLHDASQQVGSDNLLEPTTDFSDPRPWQDPQSYLRFIFAALALAAGLLAIWRFRKQRLLAIAAALVGTLIVLAVLLPWSPLYPSLAGEGAGAQQAAPLQGFFSPLRLAMLFTWVLALLSLAMLSKERRWARLLYTLLWLLFMPLFLPQMLPSFCSRPPQTPEIAEAIALGQEAREANAEEDAGDIPNVLRDDDLLGDTTVEVPGAIELENGLQLDPSGVVLGVGLGVKGPVTLSDQPVFKVQGAEGIGYLRLVAAEVYTGSAWRRSEEAAQKVSGGSELPLSPIRTAKAYTTPQVAVAPILPLGRGPVAISLYSTRPQGAAEFSFRPYGHELASNTELKSGYNWRALLPVLKPEEIRKAKTARVSGTLLQLPARLPQRVKDLAGEITRGKATEYDKLEAIREYLWQNYVYDLDNSAPPPGKDAVDFFLFEDQRGVCGAFSSAFVMLARAVGIPARVVGGWAISPTGEEQTVRALQAHQWAEVPFEGLGWVTFEATPGGGPSRVAGGEPNIPAATPVAPPGPMLLPPPTATPQPTATPRPTPRPTSRRLVPTETEITAIPERLRKGERSMVEGTVVAQNGATVGAPGQTAVPIEIFINKEKAQGGTLVGTGEVKQGQFQVEITVPQDLPPGDYQVIAHTIGNSVFAESWSDPQVEVYSGTHLLLVGPAEALVGEPVSITGQVLQESGQPVAEGKVEVTVEGQKLTLTPGREGGFEFTHRFQKPGLQRIVAHFTGTRLLTEKSAELQLRALLPVQLSLDWSRQLNVGQRLTLNGRLTDANGAPISGAQVSLEVAPEESTPAAGSGQARSQPQAPAASQSNGGTVNLTTDRSGAFGWGRLVDQPGRYSIKAGFNPPQAGGTYAPASAVGEVTVKRTSSLTASFPEKVKEGGSFTVSARLVEEGAAARSPVAGARIEAVPLGTPQPVGAPLQEGITSPSGVARLKVEMPKEIEGEAFDLELRFNGDSQRWPASLSLQVPLGQGPSLLWISLISLGVLAGLVGAFGLTRPLWRRWRHPPTLTAVAVAGEGTPAAPTLPSRPEAQQEPVAAQEPAAPPARATSLVIDFPQITSPLPLVWSIGEPLAIAVRLADEAGQPLAQVNIRLAAEEVGASRQVGTVSLLTDSDGRCQAQVSFTRKGNHLIAARYEGDPGLLASEASRAILVVDYREEIVRLYNTFIAGVRDRYSLIPEDATPREVERIMVTQQIASDEVALDEFIEAFEEADYSLHPIERRHYERAYRAYHALTASSQQSAPHPLGPPGPNPPAPFPTREGGAVGPSGDADC